MMEFDCDRDVQLDIDEFITMMNIGDEMNFSTQSAKESYLKIRKGRKVNVLDFLKVFKSVPRSFMPSFFHERWTKLRKNLPAESF